MLSMRLMPVGKKHQRSFRVVVDVKRHKLTGKNIEDLGWYNPHTNAFEFNNERINYWLKNGAQPTDTTHNLLVKSGVIKGKKIAVHSVSKKSSDAPDAASADAKALADKKATEDKEKEGTIPSAGEEEAPKAEVVAEVNEEAATESKEEAPAEEVKAEAPAEGEKKQESESKEEDPKREASAEPEEEKKEEKKAERVGEESEAEQSPSGESTPEKQEAK